jgi:hypothetical protein
MRRYKHSDKRQTIILAASLLSFLSLFEEELTTTPLYLSRPRHHPNSGAVLALLQHLHGQRQQGRRSSSASSTHQQHEEKEKKLLLIPDDDVLQQNPYRTPTAVSSSGVVLGPVHDLLEQWYPPEALQERNAVSRSDGYWPYHKQGIDPPPAYTYGEFDFYSFAQLLEVAKQELLLVSSSSSLIDNHHHDSTKDGITFTDIGSGAGRLVLAAAALHPQYWKLCRGIELLPGLHELAQSVHAQCQTMHHKVEEQQQQEPEHDATAATATADTGNIEWTCGSFTDPYVYFGDSQIIFCFSTCMDQSTIDSLGQAIGRQCRPGTIVITTDYPLPATGDIAPVEWDDRIPFGSFAIDCVNEMDVWCWLLGGPSKAYLHRVTKSLYVDGLFPLTPPVLSLQDKAWRVIRELEGRNRRADADAFIRNVNNNIIFHGLPMRFLTRPRK